MKISDFFKTEYCSWAAYDNLRSITSAVDGLRIASRKTVFTVKKKNINRDIKVSALSNTIILEAEYLHGDASLNGVISNMAQQFTGANNLSWLSPESSFGTRQEPTPSAPRYIYTRKPEWFDLLIPSDDDNILHHQTFEGHNVDPKYYLPILPMLLINGANGISPGARQLIFNRSAKDMLKHLQDILNNKPSKYDFKPHWNGFKGTVEKGETEKQWVIKGICEIKNTTSVEITEVPIKYTYKGYIKVLDELEESGKITGYEDHCNPKSGEFKFTVKFTRQNLAMYDHPKMMQLLKLIQNETEIYTVIDENNKLQYLDSVQEVFDIFYKTRLQGYYDRKDSMIKSLKYDISFNQNKALFIKNIIDKAITIDDLHQPKLVVEQLLKDKGFESCDGYDYLMNMNLRSLTEDGYIRLLERVKELQSQLEYIENTSPEKMWADDLSKIKKFIKE